MRIQSKTRLSAELLVLSLIFVDLFFERDSGVLRVANILCFRQVLPILMVGLMVTRGIKLLKNRQSIIHTSVQLSYIVMLLFIVATMQLHTNKIIFARDIFYFHQHEKLFGQIVARVQETSRCATPQYRSCAEDIIFEVQDENAEWGVLVLSGDATDSFVVAIPDKQHFNWVYQYVYFPNQESLPSVGIHHYSVDCLYQLSDDWYVQYTAMGVCSGRGLARQTPTALRSTDVCIVTV